MLRLTRNYGGKLISQSFQLSSYSVTFLEKTIWREGISTSKILITLGIITKAEMKNGKLAILVNSVLLLIRLCKSKKKKINYAK